MNQLAYFPLPYPGELFYSLLARYYRHVGSPKIMYAQEALFGKRFVISAYDLPGHLDAFVKHLPDGSSLSVDSIIDSLSLFGFFAAFEPQDVRAAVRQAMHLGARDIHVRLGISASRVSRLSRLQFCPLCFEEMLNRHGEPYWRRDHQLPGVLVCATHGSRLLHSDVILPSCSRHEFVAATWRNCSFNSAPVIAGLDKNAMATLWPLAIRCCNLLNHPPEAATALDWTDFYHKKMIAAGFAKSSTTIDQRHFLTEFRRYCDKIVAHAPFAAKICTSCEEWVAKLVRKHRHASHPLYHIFLQGFLEEHGEVSSPFGRGPWPCFNSLAAHTDPNPIKFVQAHRNRGKLVGVFECECGYTYTRNVNPETNHMESPRLLRYGPLLLPVLRDAISKGIGLRAAGRSLGIDPKTVVLLAQKLGLSTPWKTLPSRKIKRARKADEVMPRNGREHSANLPTEIVTGKPIRASWTTTDEAYATHLQAVVDSVAHANPPIRITVAELERRTNRRGWINKNRTHLPKTIAFLRNAIENTDSFQTRRVKWVIAKHLELGTEIRSWRVIREAGLPAGNQRRVEEIIDAEFRKHESSIV